MREIFIIIAKEKLIEIEKMHDSLLNYFLYFYYYLNLSHYLNSLITISIIFFFSIITSINIVQNKIFENDE